MAKKCLEFEFNTSSPTQDYDKAHFDGHIKDFQKIPQNVFQLP